MKPIVTDNELETCAWIQVLLLGSIIVNMFPFDAYLSLLIGVWPTTKNAKSRQVNGDFEWEYRDYLKSRREEIVITTHVITCT